MQVSEEFQLQPLPQEVPVMPEERASELAVYTAGSYSENPIDDYQNIKLDLMTKGYSEALSNATNKWVEEQDETAKQYFTSLIEDPTLDIAQKRDALNLYSVGNYISTDIKDKYIENIATVSPGPTLKDSRNQDEIIKSLQEKLDAGSLEALENDIEKSIELKNWAIGAGFATAEVVKSIPAFIWGALNGIRDKDFITGQEITAQTLRNWGSSPEDPKSKEAMEVILEKLSFLGIPYETALSYTLKLTGSEQAAIAAGVGFEALFFRGAGAATKAVVGGTIKTVKGRPKIKPGSTLDVTAAANPKLAGDIAAAALDDPQVATAMGTDSGTIISNLVFPDPVGMAEKKHYPSLDQRIQNTLSKITPQLVKTFEENRWDPSIQQATLRKADYALVDSITKENRGATYMQALSTISPTPTSKYEGKAVFGSSKDFFYSSRTQVINDYNNLITVISKSPEEMKSTLTIVDRNTGIKYTPEQLKAEPKFKTSSEIISKLPEKYEGIPIKIGSIITDDNRSLKGRVTYDSLGRATEIGLDTDKIKKDYKTLSPELKQKIGTESDFVRFVLEHEIAHLKSKKQEGQSDVEYEALINREALSKLNDLKKVKPAAKQFSIEWEWEREYSDLNLAIFGPDAVKTTSFGVDISALARSSASQLLFGGRGFLPRWFEQSAVRAPARAARQEAVVLEFVRKKIATTPYKKELSDIIDLAETTGRESIPVKELQDMFLYLKESQVEDLYETHAYWRRVNHFNYELINLTKRTELINNGFNRGLFINNDYKGPINENISFNEDKRPPIDVWDADLDITIKFRQDPSKTDGVYDVGGKKLVLLSKPLDESDLNDVKINYALVNGTISKVDLLPDYVVVRIPGYSPIKTEASWYVDITPTKLVVDGYNVSDPEVLKTYTQTKAAALSEREALLLASEFQTKYPNHVITPRLDREVSFQRIMADQEAHQELLRHAMQKGERLKTSNGNAPIEDRMVSLISSIQSLSRQNSLIVWEESVKKAFLAEYSSLLPKKEMPINVSDIELGPNPSRERTKQYKNAVTIFEQYAKIKTFGTWGDRQWQNAFNTLADIFEKWKVTEPLTKITRDTGKKGNILVETPRKLASVMFINFNIQRQWLIQPAQLYEMYLMSPLTGVRRAVELGAIRLALAVKTKALKENPGAFYDLAKKMAPTMDKKEFDDVVNAIESSGLIQEIDQNLLVHGVFSDVDRALSETSWEKAYNNLTAAPKTVSRVARKIGYDFSEMNNRLGLWLIARDKWIENNPNKDWRTKEAVEEISFDGYNLSGAMARASAYPYQSGFFSVLMQFAAISQKFTQNLLQDNATILTKQERLRLVAVRAVLWGTKYGLPGGALAYHYIDKSEDEDVKKYADILKRGLADRLANQLFMALSGAESADILTGKGMSPLGEYTTGFPPLDLVFELWNIWEEGSQNTKFPATSAVTTLFEIRDKMNNWFVTKDITEVNAFKMASMEAFSVASGMNNWAKGQLMLSTGDLITRNGNKLGLQATSAEAYAQMMGFGTWYADERWKALNANKDRTKKVDDMAKQVHQWMVHQEKELGFGVELEKRYGMINSFMTMLKDDREYTDQEITEIRKKVWELDRLRQKDVGTSLVNSYLKNYSQEQDKNLSQVKNTLQDSRDPKVRELIDILDGKGNP